MEFTFTFLRILASDLLYAGPILLFLIVIIALVGQLIGRLEGWPPIDALYHAFINATTVGYGDFRPSRPGSKALAVLLAFIGLVFTGMVVAIALHAADFAYAQVYQAEGFRNRP